MSANSKSFNSVGKKVINGLTGLGLVVFVIVHLGGNLTLFSSDSTLFNEYAKKLHDLGFFLYALEIGLLAVFVFHIVSALSVYFSKRKARQSKYFKRGNAGGASRKSLSSVSMIYTGLILLAFVVWHLVALKFGPGIAEGYVTTIKGETTRDLHRLVYEYFANPLNVILYVGVMVLLGFHLRHGFWSAFQSIGASHPKYSPVISTAGYLLAVLLAVGFLLIPVWIYIQNSGGL